MQTAAKEADIPFIPVFDAFMEKVNTGTNLLPDGLHPNNDGHQLLFEIIKPRLDTLLS